METGVTAIVLRKEWTGSILDLGGGGEGVIGRIYGQQVTAIDNRQEELDEAPGQCRKIRMDATALAFDDGTFDHVTSFYTLMYMNSSQQQKAIREAARVLRFGGLLHIWDVEFPNVYPEPFVARLEVDANGICIRTAYGIIKDMGQTAQTILEMCQSADLKLVYTEKKNGHFHYRFCKQAPGGL